jgi:hypothetical protein
VATATIEYTDGEMVTWQQEDFLPEKDLVIALPRKAAYTIKFELDGHIAYAGQYHPETILL